VGTIELKTPKVTTATYFLPSSSPARRAEEGQAVIREAYVKAISTGKADDLVRALGSLGL